MKYVYRLSIFFALFIFIRSSVPLFAQNMSSPSARADYTLAYPGLLADSPLYKLKTFRDRLISMFISDPGKKAQFDILQSDKRFLGATFLWQQRPSKKQLVLDTLSKANNYMGEAIDSIKNAKSQGMHYTDASHQAMLSNQKHQEMLSDLTKSMGESPALEYESSRIYRFMGQLQMLSR